MIKRLLNRILRNLGYEIRRCDSPHRESRQPQSEATSLLPFFDATEGMTTFEEASLLYRLAKEVHDSCIVEVGSYRGRSAVALGRGSLDSHRQPVYAVEPHEEFIGILGATFGPEDRAAFFRTMLETECYQVVRLVNLSSEVVSPNWTKQIGLLWIDGDHSYQAVKRDFECWAPHLTSNAIVAFDDSLDQNIGPWRLIHELLNTSVFQQTEVVGKVTVLKKTTQ